MCVLSPTLFFQAVLKGAGEREGEGNIFFVCTFFFKKKLLLCLAPHIKLNSAFATDRIVTGTVVSFNGKGI